MQTGRQLVAQDRLLRREYWHPWAEREPDHHLAIALVVVVADLDCQAMSIAQVYMGSPLTMSRSVIELTVVINAGLTSQRATTSTAANTEPGVCRRRHRRGSYFCSPSGSPRSWSRGAVPAEATLEQCCAASGALIVVVGMTQRVPGCCVSNFTRLLSGDVSPDWVWTDWRERHRDRCDLTFGAGDSYPSSPGRLASVTSCAWVKRWAPGLGEVGPPIPVG